MVSFRSWQEAKSPKDKYDETRVISIFPIDRGFLITMRSHFKEKTKPIDNTFGHYETTFFATFEQANEIAHTLLTHLRPKHQNTPTPLPPDKEPTPVSTRKIIVDGKDFEWTVTQGIHESAEVIAAMQARGQHIGVVIWDKDRRQYKAPIGELSALPATAITPGQVEAWIKEHVLGGK